ncbi:hypothetical protein [Nocardia sp. CC227C]|uniref:hypothetical protein n=1 Tax=Nocardia sp. CC227C TaxID=3044562 RepID=UPI00278C493D|nr:hypothetical protein [Nocardia sp. CC227C]
MSHAITALILPDPISAEAADRWDLVAVPLPGDLTLLHVTHYYTAYWQARLGISSYLEIPSEAPGRPGLFPREGVVTTIAIELAARPDSSFAVVLTDYFGGTGEQWAAMSIGGRPVRSVNSINTALRALGVRATAGSDEFDTVGLAAHRSTPDYLDRYIDLCDELGV